MDSIRYEKKERIGYVTIARPEVNNALSSEVLAELDLVLQELENDTDVYCAVITGAGQKSFVAGADLAQLKDLQVFAARQTSIRGQSVFRRLELLAKPVIAAVNGYALGGGLELAMSCDMRIASENAVFGMPEVTLGITPGWGGTQRLARLVGMGNAKWLIYSGSSIKAEEALRIGLVEKVVPLDQLLEEAANRAKKIASNAPIAVRYSKAAINRGASLDMDSACAYEAELFSQCFASEDQKDGMAAFLEKRKIQQFNNR